ncbi:MAG TPA: hypothetical protein VMW72_03305 [Sedimentisphaerales bacterium]|nr:hypothetical protein [Sedimentisphaerales bacterium]
MKSSKKDEWLDQLISWAAVTDKPVPNFNKWMKEHPDAVQSLKTRAEHLRSKSPPRRKNLSPEPLFIRFPRLTWACGLAALLLIVISWLACFILSRKVVDLRHELEVAQRDIAAARTEGRLEEARQIQQKTISTLYHRVEQLEQRIPKIPSAIRIFYPEEPYYLPDMSDGL